MPLTPEQLAALSPEAQAEISALITARDTALNERNAAATERDAALGQVGTLTAELTTATTERETVRGEATTAAERAATAEKIAAQFSTAAKHKLPLHLAPLIHGDDDDARDAAGKLLADTIAAAGGVQNLPPDPTQSGSTGSAPSKAEIAASVFGD